ncbi:IS66 family transposase zinc-finger binding domain-containing protein [Bradyrhizobium sp. IC4061]|uniref:IS66 family transposase n=1 Tax=Bradyrhizobium sp. IC4061 TaxID=2793808 RepID=UPI0034E2A3D3
MWPADAANARAALSDNEALIAHLELRIEKLKRELYGQRSERTARLIEQLELKLEELVTTASEDELAAQAAAAKTQNVRPFMRKRPVRKPWPDDIERERVVIEAPTTCACCGGSRLAKIGEDVTKTLEEIPRRFKLIETVREKFTCRDCEKISQPPRRSTRRRAASSVRNCWRRSCSTNSASISRSTARVCVLGPRGSTCRCRRWLTRSATEPSPSCRCSS